MVRIFDLFSHQGLAFSASIYIISTLLGYKVDCGFPLDGRHFRSHFSWTVAILALPMLTCDAFLTNGHHFRVSNIEFLSNGSHYRQHFRRTVASFASPSMGFCRMVCILYRISNERSPSSRFPWSRSCPRRNFLPTVCISTSIVPSCRIGRKGVRIAMFSYTNRHVSDRRSFGELCSTYLELITTIANRDASYILRSSHEELSRALAVWDFATFLSNPLRWEQPVPTSALKLGVSVASWGRRSGLTAHGSRPQDHRPPTS